MKEYYCSKCQTSWNSPDLESVEWEKLAQLVRSDHYREFRSEMSLCAELSLSDIKSVQVHISRVRDRCNECQQVLIERGIVTCSHCGSLVYNV